MERRPWGPCPVDDVYYGQTGWPGDRYVVPCGLDRLQIYEASTDTWETITAGRSPVNSRSGSAIVWTGTDLIAWGGPMTGISGWTVPRSPPSEKRPQRHRRPCPHRRHPRRVNRRSELAKHTTIVVDPA